MLAVLAGERVDALRIAVGAERRGDERLRLAAREQRRAVNARQQAGVPLRAPVAGIAMGLISDTVDGETEYAALTDILGAEDAFGDMDFKVAGTREFVTALQLDTKLDGIPAEVLAGALTQAKDARMTILDVMARPSTRPRRCRCTPRGSSRSRSRWTRSAR